MTTEEKMEHALEPDLDGDVPPTRKSIVRALKLVVIGGALAAFAILKPRGPKKACRSFHPHRLHGFFH